MPLIVVESGNVIVHVGLQHSVSEKKCWTDQDAEYRTYRTYNLYIAITLADLPWTPIYHESSAVINLQC